MNTRLQSRAKSSAAFTRSSTPALGGLLQRKCACGGEASNLTGECAECSKNKTVGSQTKLRVNDPADIFEQEADRVAGQVSAKATHSDVSSAPRRIQRVPRQSIGPMDAAPASVEHALSDSGRPLEPPLRQEMERRFGHDFSLVRVHCGPAAEQSAREVNAHAYTAGHNMVFGAGRFAPETHEGQRLIAHELTHVVQQSGNDGMSVGQTNDKRDLSPVSLPMPIQRKPDDNPPRKEPPKEEPAKKTLQSEGVGLTDPVAKNTPAIIDTVLARNQKLAPYIGGRLKAGFSIAEKGKFIHESNDGNFENAYRKAYDLNTADPVPKQTQGFYDPKTSEVHVRPGAEFGTAMHESVHRLASPNLYDGLLKTANDISTSFAEVLQEGVTAFFTDSILKDEGLPNFNDAYRSKKRKAETLIAALGDDGFDLIAKFNFKGSSIVEIGEKLGFTRDQYVAAREKGIREVMKRMEQAM
jgi:hypothetical protein